MSDSAGNGACAKDESGAEAPSLGKLQYAFTPGLPELLSELGASLLITTYQAGKLLLVRAKEGRLSALVRNFDQPMGAAFREREMILGCKNVVWQFINDAGIAAQLDPPRSHDACFVPRKSQVTGDIRVHELGWVRDQLTIVNTRFSCLCRLDDNYSFVPTWQPPFVTRLVAEDRCHLNGMAIDEQGELRYVTALATTDTEGGWREHKADGGVVLRYPSGEVVSSALSMPHSPRLYGGRLWVLNSGRGTLEVIDQRSGQRDVVAQLPGFLRGLSFSGRYAFVGSSKIRESSAFAGVPIERMRDQLRCGVFVVDLSTGQCVGALEFQSGCTELFSVEVLPGLQWPTVLGLEREDIENVFVLPENFFPRVRQDSRGDC